MNWKLLLDIKTSYKLAKKCKGDNFLNTFETHIWRYWKYIKYNKLSNQ